MCVNNPFNWGANPNRHFANNVDAFYELKPAPKLPLSRFSKFPHHNPWSDGLRFCESTEFRELNTGLLLSAKGQHVLCLHHLCIPGRSNWNPGQRLLLVTRTWHAIDVPEGKDWVKLTQTRHKLSMLNGMCWKSWFVQLTNFLDRIKSTW